jgi:N-sulfoglucosamine sulfohydrolase
MMFRMILLVCCVLSGDVLLADDRPNVIWIISDDLGPELGCYGYPDVATPNLDRLAASGRRYTHAFSTAPVCSASRTAFQTGLYQTTVGGHHHNTRDKRVLPESIPTVTGLMQKAGYFVINGRGTLPVDKKLAKSHLNFVYDAREFFDGMDWTQRAEGQPFFAQIQIKEPHRGFVKSDRARPNAPIPPYYPDHPVTRADWSNYLASIEVLDQKVGAVLDRLEKEGLADNTLVIFFGDHGRPHVRGKQWLYDGGVHTPLIVRWPGRVKAGEVEGGLASLLDAMPTTLAAVGAGVPDLPGHNLLDPSWMGHARVFAARDRCGDAPDRIRSVRTHEFKYIRNFHPEMPYLQHSGYKKLSYPVETLMKVMHKQGRWNSPFMAKTRPKEELYDLKADPHEMKNLADDPIYFEQLTDMRGDVEQWIVETGDKGAIDERQTVDIDALKEEKWKWYSKVMKSRGLDPDLSDREYLKWLKKDLGVE